MTHLRGRKWTTINDEVTATATHISKKWYQRSLNDIVDTISSVPRQAFTILGPGKGIGLFDSHVVPANVRRESICADANLFELAKVSTVVTNVH